MTRVLGFERQTESAGGRPVRRCRFEPRSSLPVSAACVVANGIRETLGAVVGQTVRVLLMEPLCPQPHVWATIMAGARCYEVHGTLNDAAFILRGADALALVRTVFEEGSSGEQLLSPIEEEVLQRLLRSLAATLTPVCGNSRDIMSLREDPAPFATFFEVLIEHPSPVRLGVALAREAAAPRGPAVRPENLLDVMLEARAEFASATIDTEALLALRPGVTLNLRTPIDALGKLVVAGQTIALGQCGSRGERRAFSVSKRFAP